VATTDPGPSLRPVTQSHWQAGSDEAGFVMQCTAVGSARAAVTLHENTRLGNTFEVAFDANGTEVRQTVVSARPFVVGPWVYAAQDLKEQRAVVRGFFHTAGRRVPASEVVEEDGVTVARNGWRQPLHAHLRLSIDRRPYVLACQAQAFWFTVTRTPA
jgi:hypothetical protein